MVVAAHRSKDPSLLCLAMSMVAVRDKSPRRCAKQRAHQGRVDKDEDKDEDEEQSARARKGLRAFGSILTETRWPACMP